MTHFYNGLWHEGTGETLTSQNPATEELIWEGQEALQAEVTEAIRSAKEAFALWARLPLKERASYLQQFKKKLSEHQEELAQIISQEVGKPLWESKGEVAAMIGKVDISLTAYQERCPVKQKEAAALRHKPHGVAVILGPYNFPGHLPNGHIVPALLAGNCVILKPSELTPLVSQKMIQLWEACGIPPGVVSLLQGGKETGKLLAADPNVDALFFTGSWETGKLLLKNGADHPEKILALEMGGNNPLIVGQVSDKDAAAYLTLLSAFVTSGQRCSCARRLFVPVGGRGDSFLEKLLAMTEAVRIGDYRQDPEPFIGPLISSKAAAEVLDAEKKRKKLGGTHLLPLRQLDLGSAFLAPGIIDVTQVKELPDEEIFGPLLQVIRYSDFDEAVNQANQTEYGLTAGLLSDEENEYRYFYEQIRAGVVNWNAPTTGASSAAPFGGIGKSGNYRPSAYYAADYCSYPVASTEEKKIRMPSKISPGIVI